MQKKDKKVKKIMMKKVSHMPLYHGTLDIWQKQEDK